MALLAVLVLLLVTAAVLLQTQRSQRIEQIDADITAQAEQLAASIAPTGLPRELPILGDDTVIQIVAADGTIVAQSEDLAEEADDDREASALIIPVVSLPIQQPDEDGELDDVEAQEVTLPDGDHARAAAVTVMSADGPVTVSVARSEVDVEDSVEALTTTLALGVPVVALLMAGTTWILVGRTLRPVDDIRRRVGEIGADELAKRVPEPGTDDEVDHLARTMNRMLDRLQGAAEREQRFVSDSSHELRSPLTRMRVALEVDRDHPGTADPAATSASLLEEVIGMEHLVEDLLQLAAGDASAGQHRPVDLDHLLLAEVQVTSGTTDLAIEHADVDAVQVSGDARALGRVIGNLLDNAVRHASSTITVSLREADGDAVLTVADDGPGIHPDDRDRVFERFVRLDESRTASAGGTGLGLAIVRSIVTRHDGTISVADRPGDGAALTVRLPKLPEGPSAPP